MGHESKDAGKNKSRWGGVGKMDTLGDFESQQFWISSKSKQKENCSTTNISTGKISEKRFFLLMILKNLKTLKCFKMKN